MSLTERSWLAVPQGVEMTLPVEVHAAGHAAVEVVGGHAAEVSMYCASSSMVMPSL